MKGMKPFWIVFCIIILFKLSCLEAKRSLFDLNSQSPSSLVTINALVSVSTVSTPTFSNLSGHFLAPAYLTISTTTAGATIYYTNDGSDPTTSSKLYTAPIHVWFLAGKTIKAIGIKSGMRNSNISTNNTEFSYSPLKSGQTLCYNSTIAIACPGNSDDGATQLGVARSYTDNGDGTVTDTATGFLWQKCSLGLSGTNCASGTILSLDWATAQTSCSALTTADKIWRIPTRYELETLPDFSLFNPAINGISFPATDTIQYWSATEFVGNTANAWVIIFNVGSLNLSLKSNSNRVRCVSGDVQASFVKFVDNGDGTIKDKQTGLTWQKCSIGQNNDSTCSGTASTVNWLTALTSCSGLSLAGKTWRLPSIKELETIIDTTVSVPPINTTFFPSTPTANYWSSTTLASATAGAWAGNFNNGAVGGPGKGGTSQVRCVTGP